MWLYGLITVLALSLNTSFLSGCYRNHYFIHFILRFILLTATELIVTSVSHCHVKCCLRLECFHRVTSPPLFHVHPSLHASSACSLNKSTLNGSVDLFIYLFNDKGVPGDRKLEKHWSRCFYLICTPCRWLFSFKRTTHSVYSFFIID